ncbi:hypothetical protein SB00175_01630 [Klebsiella oxytoca]|nr:hypothetical protein SB00175_01630 [Klebsiella oxytoca]
MRIERRSKGHLLLTLRRDRQVGGNNIPFTCVKRADELVTGHRNKDDPHFKVTMLELFLFRQALIETAFKLHKYIVSRAALGAFIDKEKSFAEGG